MSIKLHGVPLIVEGQGPNRGLIQAYYQHNFGVILKLKTANISQTNHQDNTNISKIVYLLSEIVNIINEYFTQNTPSQKDFSYDLSKLIAPYNKEIDTIGIAFIKENELNIWGENMTAILLRNGVAVTLIDENGKSYGQLYEGDRVVIIDKAGLAIIGKEYLREQLTTRKSIDNLVDDLQVKLTTNQVGSIVSLIVQVKDSLPIIQSEDETSANKRQTKISLRIILRHLFHSLPTIKTVIIIITLVVLFLFVRWITKPSVSKDQLSATISMAEHNLEEGTALIELNRVRARSVLKEGEQELNEILLKINQNDSEYKSKIVYLHIQDLLVKLKEAQILANSSYEVEPKTFFDLSLIRDNLTADELDLAGSSILIYSSKNQLVAELNIETKASEVIAGGSWLITAKFLTGDNNNKYVFTNSGVNILGTNNSKIVIEKDQEWGSIVDLNYFGGNLYLLSKEGLIWKYLSAGDSFSSKRPYLIGKLSSSGEYKIPSPEGFAIDGSIWVISGNKVLKFVAGRRDSYYIKGLDEELGDNLKIFKTPNLDNIYLLDKKRIIVLGEDGLYKSQYSWEKPEIILDFVVSENMGAVYLLTKDKILSFSLE